MEPRPPLDARPSGIIVGDLQGKAILNQYVGEATCRLFRSVERRRAEGRVSDSADGLVGGVICKIPQYRRKCRLSVENFSFTSI
jgi:hypothetical protein